ncbi:hypothetical protein ACPPVT_01275 [Angustibacter sp. McL0619]|uniref:hypothetical protein n=1 Tax=Angustibacter sp. McL0619 TaxID=3415676 RepID=UPI003CE7F588
MTVAPQLTRSDSRAALSLARRPWSVPTCAGAVVVRGTLPGDLAAVALLHGRCSAPTLLQRYLKGGRAPSLTTLSKLLHRPLVVAAFAPDGGAVALASATRAGLDAKGESEPATTLQLGLLVRDDWQQRGVGRALAAHLAASAQLLGFRELVADVASQGLPLRRILDGIGSTRSQRNPLGSRLRTRLDDAVLVGLGPVRLAS